jgi:hypothetical protein
LPEGEFGFLVPIFEQAEVSQRKLGLDLAACFSSGVLASITTTIKTFLCTSIPAIFIASSWRGSGRTHAK